MNGISSLPYRLYGIYYKDEEGESMAMKVVNFKMEEAVDRLVGAIFGDEKCRYVGGDGCERI